MPDTHPMPFCKDRRHALPAISAYQAYDAAVKHLEKAGELYTAALVQEALNRIERRSRLTATENAMSQAPNEERFCPIRGCSWTGTEGQCPTHYACAFRDGPTAENTPQDAADYSAYNGDKGVRPIARLAEEWDENVIPDLSRFP
jgi:hypothetical protein